MKNIVKTVILCALALASLSCTKGFEEMNSNPNAAESVNSQYYMTKVLALSAYRYSDDCYRGLVSTASRYITLLTNADNDGFNWKAQSWDDYYKTISVNHAFRQQAEKEGLAQYAAVSDILDVFLFDVVTSCWGDCPYSEASKLKDSEIIYPSYDKQSDIYPDLLKRLAEANETLMATTGSIDGTADIMYGGNILKWRKFANSLRLRMLLKESKANPSAINDIKTIVADSNKYPIFTSNADAAEIRYVEQNKFFMGPATSNITDNNGHFIKTRPSKEIIDFMLPRRDPRLAALFDKVEDPGSCTVDFNEYVGVPIALKAPYEYNGGQSGLSKTVSTFSKAKFHQDINEYVKASFIIYPEVCFILSEVAKTSGVNVPGETAESLYYKGIRASLEYWGAGDGADEYLAGPLVKFDGTQKQILTQKWVALFIKSAESWFDYRRTGDVVGLNDKLVKDNLRQDFIPFRFIYPNNEKAYNNDKYKAAVEVFGPDDINTKMWLCK